MVAALFLQVRFFRIDSTRVCNLILRRAWAKY
jgi:hypothetical protein